MKIGIIGSGNVAYHFARALSQVSSFDLSIWFRNESSVSVFSKIDNLLICKDISEAVDEADLVIIAVKDSAIPEVILNVARYVSSNAIVTHTSGATSLSVFEGKVKYYGVIYPLQTFTKEKDLNFNDVPLLLEGCNSNILENIKIFSEKVVNKCWEVNSEDRKILHLTAVFACNFTNHLYDIANDILVSKQLHFDMLRPLIVETANKVLLKLPHEVQTGPAIRNDNTTIKMHEDLLNGDENVLNIYQILTNSIKNKFN